MKKLKNFINFAFYIVIIILIIYICTSIIAPQKTSKITGYQFYTVLTNSMEPEIPTYSLVCVKNFEEDKPINLKPKQIITFNANRFGQDIVITHYFNKTEINSNGEIIYRTNSEGTDSLDSYETKRNDLIGSYVFHIPYIGKILLFLKSKFGFVLYGELLIIFLINRLIKFHLEDNVQSK